MCVLGYKETDEVSSDPNSPSAMNESQAKKSAGIGSGKGPITVDDLQFRVSVEELRELMELKSQEAKEKLDQVYDGPEGLAQKLHVDILTGISGDSEDLKMRTQLYGKNEIPPKKAKSIFILALEALRDTTLIMLMICAIVSIGLSFYQPPSDGENTAVNSNVEWIEGVAILVAVFVVVSVTAFNDWRKERQFRGLKARIEKEHLAAVVRKGEIIEINVKDLVVGDICCIKYGDIIPADGVVVQASDLKIDESSLTGETDLIKKNATDNMLVLSGTQVMEGTGKYLVTGVGLNSQTGIIMTLLGATNEKKPKDKKKTTDIESGPESGRKGLKSRIKRFKEHRKEKAKNRKQQSVLQKKLGKLALQIGYAGMSAAGLTFVILCLRLVIKEFAINHKSWSNIYIKYFISFLIQAITVIVVAVPEGLPLAVTLALAFAVRKMTKDNNLVRHLDACETMGNATTICSDKTGTLTTNRMTVVQCWIGDEHYRKVPEKQAVNEHTKELLFNSIAINSAYTSKIEPSTQLGDLPKQIGNKTECGLLGFVSDLGGDYAQIRTQFPNDQFAKCYTFNSARKMMSTIVKIGEGHYRIYSKGASEMVLSKCKYFLDKNGNVSQLTSDKNDQLIKNVVETMASEALRTICIAYRDVKYKDNSVTDENEEVLFYKDLDNPPDWDNEENLIKNMVCICLVGIEDPVRDEVPDAIQKCQTSGVVVRMVTGDNIATATSIALKCGIIKPSDDFLILESKEFNKRIRDSSGKVNQELLDKVWPRLRVLARSSPQDKYTLVNGIVESKISSNREVVAVTGDGTNDGPALKRADVGFAMGIQGTEVAKEASDIILTDDNFSSIVKAVKWGRNVYDSIAKFLQFQLTANVTAAALSVVCAASIQSVPIKAIQMLWVNLVMDTLASLALATEPPTDDLLKRAPYGRTKSLISTPILKSIIGHAFYQLAILFGIVWGVESWMGVENVTTGDNLNKMTEASEHFTIIFNAFVLMTLFNEINARKIHNERNVFNGIHRNFIFIGIWTFCLIGQVIIVCFGGVVFSVKPIGWKPWLWCIAFGVGSLIWNQVLITIPDKWVKKVKNTLCCGCIKLRNRIEARKANKKERKAQEAKIEEELEEEAKKLDSTTWVRSGSRMRSQLKLVEEFTPDPEIPNI